MEKDLKNKRIELGKSNPKFNTIIFQISLDKSSHKTSKIIIEFV